MAADDLVVRGVNVPVYAMASTGAFAYDATTFTATWTVATTGILNDKLLDGEWADPTGINVSGDAFPSGDGTAGGDFRFRLHVLPGDVNRNGNIQGNDVTLVRNAQGATPGGALYTIFKDVNGSANIQGNDVTLVRNRQGNPVPAGTFAREAGATTTATASKTPQVSQPIAPASALTVARVTGRSSAAAPLRAADLEPLQQKGI